mmetsp:Transcript_12221/g.10520  ORF Transcript_12221/g.10520 Transcript_12221/m.10520 type:complete len:113 (+) Transcript_12221:1823-2161(+)
MKKFKDINILLKDLLEAEDDYCKERNKLVSSKYLNLQNDDLVTYWKMIQNNSFLLNRYGALLIERIKTTDKKYNEASKHIEKEFKNNETVVANALKRATTYAKNFEKAVEKK